MRVRNPIFIHYVHDMRRAKDFYCSVFEVQPAFESPGWTTLDLGPAELALHILSPQSSEPEAPLPHAGLNLEVDDIEDMARRIRAAGGTMVELREATGGVPVRVAMFRDCESNGFELRQHPH